MFLALLSRLKNSKMMKEIYFLIYQMFLPFSFYLYFYLPCLRVHTLVYIQMREKLVWCGQISFQTLPNKIWLGQFNSMRIIYLQKQKALLSLRLYSTVWIICRCNMILTFLCCFRGIFA